MLNSITEPGIYYHSYELPPVGTHNTLPPFSSQMMKGIKLEIHVIKIIGNINGPKIYVGGGIHGDETNGIEAALKIQEFMKPSNLKGKIIIVPVQNPGGLHYRMRLNPYDPIDPDWVHPGKPTGTYTQRVKHILNNLARNADCVIDLHTAGRGGINNTMIYTPPETGNGAGKLSLELSIAFGGDRIIQGEKDEDYGWPVTNTMPFVAARGGRAGIYAEAGEGGSVTPNPKHVDYFVTGILNVLKVMGMIDGKPVIQGERVVVDPLRENSISVRVKEFGIHSPLTCVGNKVKKGQILAKVRKIPSGIDKFDSPINGIVTWQQSFGPVSKGDRLFTISP
jgi:predicted deacylase